MLRRFFRRVRQKDAQSPPDARVAVSGDIQTSPVQVPATGGAVTVPGRCDTEARLQAALASLDEVMSS